MPSTLKLGTVVLTKLDLEYNFMRYARGKQAVRDAVKDRSGFVLHLSQLSPRVPSTVRYTRDTAPV
jgi:hypothetical protein